MAFELDKELLVKSVKDATPHNTLAQKRKKERKEKKKTVEKGEK